MVVVPSGGAAGGGGKKLKTKTAKAQPADGSASKQRNHGGARDGAGALEAAEKPALASCEPRSRRASPSVAVTDRRRARSAIRSHYDDRNVGAREQSTRGHRAVSLCHCHAERYRSVPSASPV